MTDQEEEVALYRVRLTLCTLCLAGAGGQCHTPGCALWINRAPDLSLLDRVLMEAGVDKPAATMDDVAALVAQEDATEARLEAERDRLAARAAELEGSPAVSIAASTLARDRSNEVEQARRERDTALALLRRASELICSALDESMVQHQLSCLTYEGTGRDCNCRLAMLRDFQFEVLCGADARRLLGGGR